MKVHVLLVDDQRFVREGLARLLVDTQRYEIVADVGSPLEAEAICHSRAIDVVIVNHETAGSHLLACARKLREDCPRTALVVLTRFSSSDNVVPVIQAGARAVISKTAAFTEILDALDAVREGRTYLSPHIQTRLVQDLQGDTNGTLADLSDRERAVLALIADGKRTRDIAKELDISTKTIDKCRTLLMAKLKLHSIAELTKYAIRHGLSPLD